MQTPKNLIQYFGLYRTILPLTFKNIDEAVKKIISLLKGQQSFQLEPSLTTVCYVSATKAVHLNNRHRISSRDVNFEYNSYVQEEKI